MQSLLAAGRGFLRRSWVARTVGAALASSVLLVGGPAQAQHPGGAVAPIAIDAGQRAEIVEGLAKTMQEGYTYADKGAMVAKTLRAQLKRGAFNAYDRSDSLAQALTNDLTELLHDKHLFVAYLGPRGSGGLGDFAGKAPPPEVLQAVREQFEWDNYAFETVQRLDGNVGYLKMNAFMEPESAGEKLRSALRFLDNTAALIIDLRDNQGGSPDMVMYMLSFFFERPEFISTHASRAPDTQRQYWALPTDHTLGYTNRPVYILVSSRTISGGEGFAFNMQRKQRGIVVGETTAGAAHPSFMKFLPQGFGVSLPMSHAVEGDWEGVGVVPDVKIAAPEALRAAHRLALEEMLRKKPDDPRRPELEAVLKRLGAGTAPAN